MKVLVFGATGDIGAAVVRHLEQFGGRPLVAPRLIVSEDLTRQISAAEAVINCTGVTRPAADSPAANDRVFAANVLLPALIAAEADRQGKTAVHLSTWAEEAAPNKSCGLDARGPMTRQDPVAGLRNAPRLMARWRQAMSEGHPPYLTSKLMLEETIATSGHSVAIRLSNVMGPQMQKPRLLPRLIEARLRGQALALRNEPRNYFTEKELAGFLFACAAEARLLPGKVVPGLGTINTTVAELAEAVRRSLPTCYGQLLIEGECRAPTHRPSIDRYFPAMSTPSSDLQGIVREIARGWRRKLKLLDSNAIGEVAPRSSRERIRGGSIARKRLTTRSDGVVLVEKHSDLPGFEGAAAPKLAAEVKFYGWLIDEAPPALLALYAEPTPNPEDDTPTVRTIYGDEGLTIADAIAYFPEPRAAVRTLVEKLYHASYLQDLKPLSTSERLFQLLTLYIDRPEDRLRCFAEFAKSNRDTPKPAVELVRELLSLEDLEVDGAAIRNPLSLLSSLRHASTDVRLTYAPTHAGRCGHGDLTILNMLWRRGKEGTLLIDPRGLLGVIDPIYDLGKLLFSLSGFALLMRGGISWQPISAHRHRLRPSQPQLLLRSNEEHAATLEWLGISEAFRLLRSDPYSFQQRLLLAEASHYLADVPYRYAQGRDWNRAITVLLLGAKRLSDLFTESRTDLGQIALSHDHSRL